MAKVTLEVMNPRGEVESLPGATLSPRLDTLVGKRVGILFNGKPGGKMLMPHIETALKSRAAGIQFRDWLVHYQEPPETKDPKLKEIAGYSDGVIVLISD